MTNDLVFVVKDADASPLQAVSLEEAGFRERQHLQEWVRKNPRILGDGVMIVTLEFDKWTQQVADRLDILALDKTGRLVVAELKRGVAPDVTDMQALKYAAMASTFTLDKLAQRHAEYLSKIGGNDVASDEAKRALQQHVGTEETAALAPLLERPRIILIANDFPATVTSTAVFLGKFGLEMALVEFQAYKTPSQEFILTLNQVFPIEGAESLQIEPQAFEAVEKAANEGRQRRAVLRLIENHAIPDGDELTLVPPAKWAERLKQHLAGGDGLTKAKWDEKNHAKPLIWGHDNQNYSPSGLCHHIIDEAGQQSSPVQGPAWWQNKEGRTLLEIADSLTSD